MAIEIAAAAVQAIKFLYAVGQKVSEVIVDETVMRELLIPRPRMTESPEFGPDVVRGFFDGAEGKKVLAGLPDVRASFDAWQGAADDVFLQNLLPIYLTHRTAVIVLPGNAADRTGYLTVKAFIDKAQKPNSAFQRILGEVVNQGLDFLSTNPGLLGVSSKTSRILQPVIEGLAARDLAEEKYDALLKGAFGAVLGGLDGLAETKIGSKGLRLLTSDLIASVQVTLKDGGAADFDNYFSLRGPLLQPLLRTAATTVSVNSDVFFGKDRALVSGLVLPLVDQIRTGEGDLFTPENGSALLSAAIGALGSRASSLVKIKDAKKAGFVVDLLQDLGKTLSTAVETGGFENFEVETLFRDLGSAALNRVGQNLTLFLPVDADGKPNHELAVSAAAATLGALKTALAEPGDVLDQALLTNWMDQVFTAVGENVALRDTLTKDTKASALFQVVGSVARAVGADSAALLNRSGRQELLAIALEALETQAPTLLDLKSDKLESNLLDGVLQGVFAAVKGDIPVSQAILLDLVRGTIEGAVNAAVRKGLKAVEASAIIEKTLAKILDSWNKKLIALDPVLEMVPVIIQGALTTAQTDIGKFVLAQITPKKGKKT